MSKNFFYNFIVLLIIFHISRASILASKWFAISLTMVLLSIVVIKKKPINLKIIYIILIWIGINTFAIITTGSQFTLLRIFSTSVIFFLFPYLTLNIMGISFWYRFEKIVYILTLISIPIFIINLMFPVYFDNLVYIFHTLTGKHFYYDPASTYWSSLIYVHGVGSPIRNSGFMWEPGAFAMMIIWAIVFNWFTKGIRFDKRFFIYAIAMATTLSTAGYFSLFVVILTFYIRKVTLKNAVMLIIVSLIFVFYVYKLDFVGGELNYYIEEYQKKQLSYSKVYEATKVSRFKIVEYDLEKILKNPFGYGVISKKDYSTEEDIVGVNGLTSLMVMWGIPIFIFIIYLIKRYFNLFNVNHYNKQIVNMLFIGLLMMFFSNPIARNPFVYFILLTPLIIRESRNIT